LTFVSTEADVYEIVIPALAVPATAVATVVPLIENTISKRSPTATGTGTKFDDAPKSVVPTAKRLVRGGARFTLTPVGLKILLPAGAR
jgi:hypothetical protein